MSRPDHAPKAPPFEPGNTAAQRHGAFSERRWSPIADELAAELVRSCPWLARPAFRLAVAAWARCEAQASLVDGFLDDHGLLTDDGEPRPANALADRLHGRAIALRAQLGVDPASHARLLASYSSLSATDAADVLEALVAEGRRAIAARFGSQATARPALTVATSDDTCGEESEAHTALQRPLVPSEVDG